VGVEVGELAVLVKTKQHKQVGMLGMVEVLLNYIVEVLEVMACSIHSGQTPTFRMEEVGEEVLIQTKIHVYQLLLVALE